MLNIVIPMAGRGSRFADAGYTVPKPLIPLGGKPMIQWVIENVRPQRPHRFTFICLAEHLQTYPTVKSTLEQLCPGCHIIAVDHVTEGAACTVLLAREIINTPEALMIANADQLVDLSINDYLQEMDAKEADGIIMTFWADHPKWSYCGMTPDGLVSHVVEKKVISSEATVGIYNFSRGADFVRGAELMIKQNLRVNGEFYVAPVYNQLINEGQKIVVMPTGREYNGMYGLGTPTDLDFFLTTPRFEESRKTPAPLHHHDLISARTRLYAEFFAARSIAGIEALLHPGVELHAAEGIFKKRAAVLEYFTQVFTQDSAFTFSLLNFSAEDSRAKIDYKTTSSEAEVTRSDTLEFSGRAIHRIQSAFAESCVESH